MKNVYGALKPHTKSQLKKLEKLTHRSSHPDEIISWELAKSLVALSAELRCQLGLLIDRRGRVKSVYVGDRQKIEITNLGRQRGDISRLRGLRFVHTHLKDEPLSDDDLTDLMLLRLDFMVAVCFELEDPIPEKFYWAHIDPLPSSKTGYVADSTTRYQDLPKNLTWLIPSLESEYEAQLEVAKIEGLEQRAIVVAVTPDSKELMTVPLEELRELARTAGIEVVDETVQRKNSPDPKYVVGKGKLQEIYVKSMQLGAGLLIFYNELTPSQIRSISEYGSLEVWDRTQLILHIFGQRAQSQGGKLQVELAQLQYSLPRLILKDDFLSRLTGGIGARGPGETKLEILKRRVKDRIARLKKEVLKYAERRQVKRKTRQESGAFNISLVGYTNAGKSTLLNLLTGSDIFAQDLLFATLDPTSRKLRLPSGTDSVLTDTVGFIRELPEELLDAFQATLEELRDSDLLLHCVDGSSPDFIQHIESVDFILEELGLDNVKQIRVVNKSDLLTQEAREILESYTDAPLVSCVTREGIVELKEIIEYRLQARREDASWGCVDK